VKAAAKGGNHSGFSWMIKISGVITAILVCASLQIDSHLGGKSKKFPRNGRLSQKIKLKF
jgi:hypothetical protein